MNRLNGILFFLLLNFTFLWAQKPTITLDNDYIVNPTYPLNITGGYSLADGDSLYFIRYYINGDSTEVTHIDTTNHTFSTTIGYGNITDGDYYYIFKLRSKIGIAEDTLHIHVDFTPPQKTDFQVNNKYWSNAYPEFKVTIDFDEAITIVEDTTEVKLISGNGRVLNIPMYKISLQNADTRLSINVSKDLIDSDSLESWTGNVSLNIYHIADNYRNTLGICSIDNFIIADFTVPKMLSFTPHYGHLSTVDTTLDFNIIFNEELKEYENLVTLKKDKLEFQPALKHSVINHKSIVEFTLNLKKFKSDTNWNGDVKIEMQAFTDKAGNTNEVEQSLLPRIYIDYIEPKIMQKFISVDSINKAFIARSENKISGLIVFSEPLDTTKGSVFIKSDSLEVKLKPIFESNSKNVSFFIDRSLLGDKGWDGCQPKLSIYSNEFEDTLGNKSGLLSIGDVLIDTRAPDPPRIKNKIRSIVKDKTIFFEGTKEYKAKLYFNGELLESFTQDTSWSKYNVFLPMDGFYKFNFWQVDSLDNPSDTTIVRILVDRQMPQFAGQGAQLQINTDPGTNKPYFILYLFFNEIVNLDSAAQIELKTEDDYFQIDIKKAQNFSTIHKISITDSGQINKVFNWLKQQKKIQVFISQLSVTDLAGNKNTADLTHDVFVFIKSLIQTVSWENKFISPNNDNKNDELKATVILNPNVPDDILFRVVAINEKGQSILQLNEILKISEDAGKVKQFENGGLKLNVSGVDSNKVVYFYFRWAPQNLAEGKYTISFYAQEEWEQGFNLSIGSLPKSAYVYVDVTPPEIIRITPVAGDNNQYIDVQPDFVFYLDKEKEISPIKDAYLIFSKALKNDIPFTETMDLFPYKPNEIYEFNCKSYNIKLVPGELTVGVTLVDSANNMTSRQLYYVVLGDTVEGIKDVYNFPNPFNPKQGQKTNIAFVSGRLDKFKLYVFDLGFNLVYYKEFFSNSPGLSGLRKTIPWNGTNLKGDVVANGVYFARIVSDKYKSPILKIVVNNK